MPLFKANLTYETPENPDDPEERFTFKTVTEPCFILAPGPHQISEESIDLYLKTQHMGSNLLKIEDIELAQRFIPVIKLEIG